MPIKYVCPYCAEKGEEREITKAGMRMHVAAKHPEKMEEWLQGKAKPAEEIKEGGEPEPSEEGKSFHLPQVIIS